MAATIKLSSGSSGVAELAAQRDSSPLALQIASNSRSALAGRVSATIFRQQCILLMTTFGLTAAAMVLRGLHVPMSDAAAPLGVAVVLGAALAYFHRRGEPGFVLSLKSLILLVLFSSAFATLTYALATTARPWADARLAATDAAVGLSAGDWVRWATAHPTINLGLKVAYFSLIPQTILAVIVVGFGNNRQLDLFLVRFMLAGLLTALGFAFFPAAGSCVQFHLPTPSHYAGVLNELSRLRSGVTVVTWNGAEGIVTFPSFHAIWATMLAAVFWRQRLFWPLAILNAIVLATCVTTGMHYFTDVAAGLLIAVLTIAATRPAARVIAAADQAKLAEET